MSEVQRTSAGYTQPPCACTREQTGLACSCLWSSAKLISRRRLRTRERSAIGAGQRMTSRGATTQRFRR